MFIPLSATRFYFFVYILNPYIFLGKAPRAGRSVPFVPVPFGLWFFTCVYFQFFLILYILFFDLILPNKTWNNNVMDTSFEKFFQKRLKRNTASKPEFSRSHHPARTKLSPRSRRDFGHWDPNISAAKISPVSEKSRRHWNSLRSRYDPKAPSKRTQHCWMLHVASVCTPCCMLLDVVAQSFKPVKLFSQQLPTFLLFHDRRSVGQQFWIRLHSSSNIFGATHAHYAWTTKTYGLYSSHDALQVPNSLGIVASVCTPLPTRTH